MRRLLFELPVLFLISSLARSRNKRLAGDIRLLFPNRLIARNSTRGRLRINPVS